MGNEVSSTGGSWHSLYKEAESTYELDTSTNESDESLFSAESDECDDESDDESSYDSDSLDINDVLPDSIKYDASGVINAEQTGLYIGSTVYLRVKAGEDGSSLSVVDFEKYVQEQALAKARKVSIKTERFVFTCGSFS